MPELQDGTMILTVSFNRYNAYGRAAYDVTLTRVGELLFKSDALELPWRDDDRATRDAAGFLAYYATDGNPDENTGVTREELSKLASYADEVQSLAIAAGSFDD